jgi:hypothetical protein
MNLAVVSRAAPYGAGSARRRLQLARHRAIRLSRPADRPVGRAPRRAQPAPPDQSPDLRWACRQSRADISRWEDRRDSHHRVAVAPLGARQSRSAGLRDRALNTSQSCRSRSRARNPDRADIRNDPPRRRSASCGRSGHHLSAVGRPRRAIGSCATHADVARPARTIAIASLPDRVASAHRMKPPRRRVSKEARGRRCRAPRRPRGEDAVDPQATSVSPVSGCRSGSRRHRPAARPDAWVIAWRGVELVGAVLPGRSAPAVNRRDSIRQFAQHGAARRAGCQGHRYDVFSHDTTFAVVVSVLRSDEVVFSSDTTTPGSVVRVSGADTRRSGRNQARWLFRIRSRLPDSRRRTRRRVWSTANPAGKCSTNSMCLASCRARSIAAMRDELLR